MARPLAALERFFERIFERPAARLFRTRLQPVQLQRRLERVMESERRVGADRTYVPDRYRVRLHPSDHAAFASYQTTLEQELAQALLARARARRYTFVEHPRVSLQPDDRVAEGDIEIESEVRDPTSAPAGFRRVDTEGSAPGGSTPADVPSGAARPDATAVFQVPVVTAPRAVLVVQTGTAPPQRALLDGRTVRIGRAADNEVCLLDGRVSRYHGRLSMRQGVLVYTDLGSTNGSYLNGTPVTEIALGPGDVLQLGDSMLTVELVR